MRATGLYLSLLIAATLGVAGCTSTSARFKWMKPPAVAAKETPASTPKSEPVASTTGESPFKPSREVAKTTAEKPPADKPALEQRPAEAMISATTPASAAPAPVSEFATFPARASGGLSVETLKLIDEELRDASPEERAEWYDQLKRVDVALVPEILRARRLSLQVAQRQPGASATTVTAGYPPANTTASSVPSLNPFAPPAQSPPQLPQPTQSPATVPGQPATPSNWPPATAELSATSSVVPGAPASTPYGARHRSLDPTGILPAGAHQPVDDLSGRSASGANNALYVESGATQVPIQHAVHQFDGQRSPNAIVLQNHEYEAMPAPNADPTRSSATQTPFGGNGSPQLLPPTAASPTSVPWPPTKPATTSVNGLGAVTSQLPFGAGFVQNVVGLVPNRGSQTPSTPSTVPATNIAVPGTEWQQQLERTTAYLEQEVATLARGNTSEQQAAYIRKHVALRMLYLMGNHQERALTAIPGIEPAEQEFWQQLFWGVSNALDAEHIPQSKDRATQAIAQLNSAVRRLQEQADLQIRNVSFCRQIFYFGNYERSPRDEFPPGQEVLLYAEIDNFKSEPTSDGQYRTLIRSSIELLSPSGELRKQIDFPATEDLCRNYRRDYFHNYQFTIPERMPLGPHTLKLTVVDELSGKIATYRMNFLVK